MENKKVWFIESKAWSTLMTVENEISVNAKGRVKEVWQRFMPETPASPNDPNVQEFVILKTFWNTYVRASTTGTADVKGVNPDVETYL